MQLVAAQQAQETKDVLGSVVNANREAQADTSCISRGRMSARGPKATVNKAGTCIRRNPVCSSQLEEPRNCCSNRNTTFAKAVVVICHM